MDEIKKKVLAELSGMMDEKMNDRLRSRVPAMETKKEEAKEVAAMDYSNKPDKGFGAIIFKGHEEMPKEMAHNDDDEERLRQMYSKLS